MVAVNLGWQMMSLNVKDANLMVDQTKAVVVEIAKEVKSWGFLNDGS